MAHEFPGYRLAQRLHAGARSTVDRAIRVADGTLVILKQPTGEIVAADALARVQREFDLLRTVHGPEVVAALDIARDASRAALVLEDAGDTLASALDARRLSL